MFKIIIIKTVKVSVSGFDSAVSPTGGEPVSRFPRTPPFLLFPSCLYILQLQMCLVPLYFQQGQPLKTLPCKKKAERRMIVIDNQKGMILIKQAWMKAGPERTLKTSQITLTSFFSLCGTSGNN